jgi:hypothetical protein
MTLCKFSQLVGTLPPSLSLRICAWTDKDPLKEDLFVDLMDYLRPEVSTTTIKSTQNQHQQDISTALFSLSNVSILFPLRRKVDLCFTDTELRISSTALSRIFSYDKIRYIFTTQNREGNWAVCMFQKDIKGLVEPSVLFVWDKKLKIQTEDMVLKAKLAGNSHCSQIVNIILDVMSRKFNPPVMLTPSTYPLHPKVKAESVECYYKAKDSNLYFLNEGLLFGILKKPIFFFPANTFTLEIVGVTVFLF